MLRAAIALTLSVVRTVRSASPCIVWRASFLGLLILFSIFLDILSILYSFLLNLLCGFYQQCTSGKWILSRRRVKLVHRLICLVREFTSLGISLVRFPELSWGFTYSQVRSCPLLIGSWYAVLPPRKVLLLLSNKKTRQCCKFQCLHNLNILPLHVTKAVVNLSDTPLDDATHSALAKGPNFAISHSVLQTEDIVGYVEWAVSTLSVEAAEEVRQEL